MNLYCFQTPLMTALGLLLTLTSAQAVEISAAAFRGMQSEITERLTQQDVIDPDRILSHLSYVCALSVDGHHYPVFDVRELVPGAVVPRGFNRVVVTDTSFEVRAVFEYINARPLTCSEARLFLNGDIAVDGSAVEGNLITFSGAGTDLSARVSEFDINSLPQTLGVSQ